MQTVYGRRPQNTGKSREIAHTAHEWLTGDFWTIPMILLRNCHYSTTTTITLRKEQEIESCSGVLFIIFVFVVPFTLNAAHIVMWEKGVSGNSKKSKTGTQRNRRKKCLRYFWVPIRMEFSFKLVLTVPALVRPVQNAKNSFRTL